MLQEMLKAEMSKDTVHRKKRRCCQASPWCGSYPGVSFPPSSVVFIPEVRKKKLSCPCVNLKFLLGLFPQMSSGLPYKGQ